MQNIVCIPIIQNKTSQRKLFGFFLYHSTEPSHTSLGLPKEAIHPKEIASSLV